METGRVSVCTGRCYVFFHLQKLAVVSMRYDAEFGIQNRINSLFRVSFI